MISRSIASSCLALLLLFGCLGPAAAQQSNCQAPPAVCSLLAAVFVISSFDPLASAVLIEPGLLVTNRHVVADRPDATVRLPDGETLTARVVPSGYAGDLVLLQVEGLEAPIPPRRAAEAGTTVYALGADIAARGVRVYPPGTLRAGPAPGHRFARLHHEAYSQPGNSGGALVDSEGYLIGILASGGEGRNEAFPVAALDDLKVMSGPEFTAESAALGAAVRACVELLEARRRAPSPRLAQATAAKLQESCSASGNRQLFDLAAQAFGEAGRFEPSIALFEKGLQRDPEAFNTRLGLAVTLHLARRYEAEVEQLRWLIERAPADPQVLRLAVQAGKWGGAPDLAEQALDLLAQHHPQLAPVARRFYESDTPAPR